MECEDNDCDRVLVGIVALLAAVLLIVLLAVTVPLFYFLVLGKKKTAVGPVKTGNTV